MIYEAKIFFLLIMRSTFSKETKFCRNLSEYKDNYIIVPKITKFQAKAIIKV